MNGHKQIDRYLKVYPLVKWKKKLKKKKNMIDDFEKKTMEKFNITPGAQKISFIWNMNMNEVTWFGQDEKMQHKMITVLMETYWMQHELADLVHFIIVAFTNICSYICVPLYFVNHSMGSGACFNVQKIGWALCNHNSKM